MGRDEIYYRLPEFSAILSFIDAIFIDINMGLLIYHLERPGEPESLRLIYANAEASRCTGGDLRTLVGRRILEAFPGLEGTDVPRTYAGVVADKQSQHLPTVEYTDERLARASYRVKAFPMPSDCVGVLFERE